MEKNISVRFLILTFAIAYVSWGICVACSLRGLALDTDHWMYLPYLLGGWSPTIASYIVLKRNRQVSGFKEWLANVFDTGRPAWMYLFTILLAAAFFVPQIFISGVTKMNPIYILLVLVPIMLFAGGLEEAGWRYILQPALDKKIGYILSSITVSAIWAAWHLPLFFIAGTGQNAMNFGLYAVSIVGLTFALGALRKITGSVFLCVLLHCLVNAGKSVFIIEDTFWGTVAMTALLVAISVCAVARYNWNNKRVSKT